MAHLTLEVKTTVSPYINLLYPLWVVQVWLGFNPYVPKWAIKCEVLNGI